MKIELCFIFHSSIDVPLTVFRCVQHCIVISIAIIKDVFCRIFLIFLVWHLMNVCYLINTLRPRQNGRRFADDTFKGIFLNENVRVSIKISLKFVLKGSINNNPALIQIMAWRRSGDKPLSEPMIVYWRIYASLGLNELSCMKPLLDT